jgi:hypothetical protein
MKRATRVPALLLLTPWVGEFLVGNISVRRLPALLMLVRRTVLSETGHQPHQNRAEIRVACDHFPTRDEVV